MATSEAPKLNPRNIATAYAYSFGGWAAFAFLMACQDFVLMRSYTPPATFLQSCVVPIVRGTTTALLTPPLYFAVVKWPFSKKHLFTSSLRYLGLAAAFLACFTGIRWLLFPGWDITNKRWLPRSVDSLFGFLIGGFADQLVLFGLMVIAAHAWTFHRQSQQQMLKQSILQREVAELQLQLLQMQLHPHFIFNTLHGINTLMERDVDTARTMLLHLADLLRAAIASQTQDLIPLKQELSFISSYVALEKMRLGARLSVAVDVEDAANDALVPYMILQPIVENAILHGAAACREGGWVRLECRLQSKQLVLEIFNNVGPSRDRSSGGLGLRNTRARLENLFEHEANLEFNTREGIAVTRIQFPAITARAAVTP